MLEQLVWDMFYAAPGLLHPLVKKCHQDDFEMAPDTVDRLEKLGLLENGSILEGVKHFILNRINLEEDGGISMSLL